MATKPRAERPADEAPEEDEEVPPEVPSDDKPADPNAPPKTQVIEY